MAATDVNAAAAFPAWYCPETGIYDSTHPSVSLPDSPFLDVVSYIFSHTHDGRSAFVDSSTGFSISYSELARLVTSLACGLRRLGVSRGDVVLLLLPNSVYYPVAFLGVLCLGGVVTTMNPFSSIQEIRRQMADCGVRFAFASSDRLVDVRRLGVRAIAVPENVAGDRDRVNFLDFYGFISNSGGVGLVSAAKPLIRQDDMAAIVYSSGTTGVSKGVVLTHRNLISMVELFVKFEASQYSSLSSDNVYLASMPMFHIYGLSLFVLGLLALGSKVIVMQRFNPREAVRAIDKYHVSHLPVVPPMLKALTEAAKSAPETCSLKSLKQVSCGAASLNPRNIEELVQTLPHLDFIQGYGMTESTAVGTRGFNTEKFKKYSSIGLLAPNMQAKVIDCKTGNFLPPGLTGELLLRGPAIMKGYLNNAEATALAIDEDGWLLTGDIIHFDGDGFLHMHGRLKEIIKYNGFQIAPADLEAILISHPDITDVAVAGAVNEECGEIPVAFVVRRNGSTISEEGLIDFVAKQVAPYKKVREVVFISSIPKSPSGKILRRELKRLLASRL
ncbi:hypothetical protein SAY87_001567 [Trapa incisa]|uniref:4-coumarate--CoA ligase n=1 Tax=Trapa incisa TaxID=236973 RepID=A0AAN7GGZ0_9MYRT|nr:hypothetical protein SAY87_001567 [Trapa incisa]